MNPVKNESDFPLIMENENETTIKLDNLPNDIWQIIFNNLNFDDWSKLILTNRRFKLMCESPNAMISLWNRLNCIPDIKKVPFAIKVGSDLKVFDFSKIVLAEEELVKIFSCTHLQELDLGCIGWKEGQTTTIQLKQKCLHLTKLDLSRFPYSEQTILEILTASPNLTALNLSGCGLTDRILAHLPKTLHFLCLRGSIITDKQLALLQQLVNLKNLDLSYCVNITDNGLQFLNLLGGLKELYLMGCDRITEAGYDYLKSVVSIHLSLDSNWKEHYNLTDSDDLTIALRYLPRGLQPLALNLPIDQVDPQNLPSSLDLQP